MQGNGVVTPLHDRNALNGNLHGIHAWEPPSCQID